RSRRSGSASAPGASGPPRHRADGCGLHGLVSGAAEVSRDRKLLQVARHSFGKEKDLQTSAARLPALRVPSTMDDGQNDDLSGQDVEVDRVREAPYQGAPRLALDARVGKRDLDDTCKSPVDLRRKGCSKAKALSLIPITGVLELSLRLRPENK